MARPGISFEQVAHAADALVGRGEKPTITAVRDEIGTGSPNTIHRHLTAWRAAQAPAERKTAKLPDELASALAQEIERQSAAARADAEADALDARQTADSLAETGEQLEAEADELRGWVEALESERDHTAGELEAARIEVERLRGELERERQSAEAVRQELAEARNRITTLLEQRDEERTAKIEAQQEAKQAEQGRITAERELAVAQAHTEAAQAQATERLDALKTEQQARKADADAHKQALAELRDEWKERLTAAEKQRDNAQKQAQEAGNAKAKAEVRAEALAARLDALEARDAKAAKNRSGNDQPTLFDPENPA